MYRPQICAEPGCTFSAQSGRNGRYCSHHTPEGRERIARIEANRIANNVAKQRQLDDAVNRWKVFNTDRRINLRLVLGASPSENDRGRTHYNNDNVYLLGLDEQIKKMV